MPPNKMKNRDMLVMVVVVVGRGRGVGIRNNEEDQVILRRKLVYVEALLGMDRLVQKTTPSKQVFEGVGFM